MAQTPWEREAKTGTEHASQSALFMWANMAASFDLMAANDPKSYKIAGHAKMISNVRPEGSWHILGVLKRLHAIHNQGHGDAIRGAKASAEGVVSGVPDVCLPYPMERVGTAHMVLHSHYHGLYIEMKRVDGGSTSDVQDDWIEYLRSVGYRVEVCHGWEAARDVILDYLGLNS